MTKPTLFGLVGLVLAAAVVAIGYAVSAPLARRVEVLVSECKAANQKSAPAEAPAWAKDPLVCEPRELQSMSGPSSERLIGIQAAIVEADTASLAWLERSRIISILLFAVLALPYCWNFLLRRIAELRQAALGR